MTGWDIYVKKSFNNILLLCQVSYLSILSIFFNALFNFVYIMSLFPFLTPYVLVSCCTHIEYVNHLFLFLPFQELQRDIEKHSTGVASVLNLCEVLLHDCDACATDAECDSIQQATRSLDRRWRSICALSMERRLK